MQTTFRKMTSAAILRTAKIETMRAGNVEVVVTAPELAFAYITEDNNLSLIFEDRHPVFMPLSAKSVLLLESLATKQSAQQNAINSTI